MPWVPAARCLRRWLLTKLGGNVEALTSHFVALQVLSRCCSFAFWFYGYVRARDAEGGPLAVGGCGRARLWSLCVYGSAALVLEEF